MSSFEQTPRGQKRSGTARAGRPPTEADRNEQGAAQRDEMLFVSLSLSSL